MKTKNYVNSKVVFPFIASLFVVACGGGSGGGSSGGNSPNSPQALSVAESANYMTGETISGLPVVDARPLASQPTVTVTLTNPSTNGALTKLTVNPILGPDGKSTSSDFNLVDKTGYSFGVELNSIGGSCSSISPSHPLQPGQSCTTTMQIDTLENYTNNELINLNVGYDYILSGQSALISADCTQGNFCPQGHLNAISVPIRSGIWYTHQLGYDFAGNTEKVILSNTEAGVDYLFLSSGQKIRVTYDTNGVAQLDFTNDVVSCTNVGCSQGLVPNNLFTVNPYTNEVVAGTTPYGGNSIVYGLNGLPYDRDGYNGTINIPNVNQLIAVQPDGTIFGQNTQGQWGCFNNDGSNFRKFTGLTGVKFNNDNTYYTNASAQNYLFYGTTNWVMMESTSGSIAGYYKLVANQGGTCSFDSDFVLNGDVFSFTQSYSSGLPSGIQQPAQITAHGVFNLYIGSTVQSYLMFYKYPPRQN